MYGGVEIALDCEPAFDYDRTDATWEYTAARIRVSAVARSQGTGGQGLHSDGQ